MDPHRKEILEELLRTSEKIVIVDHTQNALQGALIELLHEALNWINKHRTLDDITRVKYLKEAQGWRRDVREIELAEQFDTLISFLQQRD
jgi:hypothetical protein